MSENCKKERDEKPVPGDEAADECVIPTHNVPPDEMWRYSTVGDPAAEADISSYVEGQTRDETVQYVEKVKTEYILHEKYDVWDVTTDKGRWWVITHLTNLYPRDQFPSLDYTLSFHVGLMARLRSRDDKFPDSDPEPFDEVSRRQDQAKDRLDRAVEAEDYQAVGMQLRECLLTLIGAMRRRVEIPTSIARPKDADFIGWSQLLVETLCPGGRNKAIRQYLKAVSERTWQLVNWLTHDRDANQTAASIAAYACDTLIGHNIQILVRDETDNTESCPKCSSRNIRTHFDIAIPPDGAYFNTCGECGWDNYPESTEDA